MSFRFARAVDELNALPYSRWLNMHEEYLRRIPTSDESNVTVLVTFQSGTGSSRCTLASLYQQSWPNWKLVQRDALSEQRSAEDQQILWLDLPHGTVLAPDFLKHMVEPFRARDVDVVYSDEDVMENDNRRHSPLFKPAWSPLLAGSGWLPLDGALIRLSAIPPEIELGMTSINDTVSAIAALSKSNIIHLPRVLMSRRMSAPAAPGSIKPQPAVGHVQVTVIIPTRDRKDLLSACIDGLKNRTANAEVDIIIVDNDSSERETLDFFDLLERDRLATTIRMPGPFNFARACNLGVEKARYDRILLLNNDVDPIDPDWLIQMAHELSDPSVGAVGAYLFYPDGLVQHAGVILGAGSVARHSFAFVHPDSGEDKGLFSERRDVSAVTAACLLTNKSLWKTVGGMDEENLSVAFNDVDYCLKLRRMHKRIIWTPHARLWHRESVSRGKDDTPEKLSRFAREEATMHQRWGSAFANDPFHNPNLSKVAEDFVLEAFPDTLAPRTSSWV
jgi:GT2 family glycosyltransferase